LKPFRDPKVIRLDFSDNSLLRSVFLNILYSILFPGVRGGAVVEALRDKRKVAGSIPDGVNGIFH
jgi:hypothetical protein